MCAVRWAVPTRRWIWTKRVCCQTVSVESDLSPSVDLIPAGDAPTLTQTLWRRPLQCQISLKELKSPRTGLLNSDSMNTLPWELLSVFYMQLYPVVCAWERVICVARKPVTVEAERSGRNSQPDPPGGASEQSQNGTRPKRYLKPVHCRVCVCIRETLLTFMLLSLSGLLRFPNTWKCTMSKRRLAMVKVHVNVCKIRCNIKAVTHHLSLTDCSLSPPLSSPQPLQTPFLSSRPSTSLFSPPASPPSPLTGWLSAGTNTASCCLRSWGWLPREWPHGALRRSDMLTHSLCQHMKSRHSFTCPTWRHLIIQRNRYCA